MQHRSEPNFPSRSLNQARFPPVQCTIGF